MRSRISIRGCVRPSVGPSVGPSHMSWNHTKVRFLTKTTISTSEYASYAVYTALFLHLICEPWVASCGMCQKTQHHTISSFIFQTQHLWPNMVQVWARRMFPPVAYQAPWNWWAFWTLRKGKDDFLSTIEIRFHLMTFLDVVCALWCFIIHLQSNVSQKQF